jgi:O-methyltransferase domain
MPQVLRHYDFPQSGTFVDVAGGNGSLLAAILQARPQARGIVMDLAFARPDAEPNLKAQGVDGRCRFEAGDFFASVPAGGDLYTMKWILHDFADDKAGAILRNVRAAMPATAKLLLIEAIVPEDGDALMGHMMDMNMLVMCGGRERTAAHWRELLAVNGFGLNRIIAMPGPVSILETAPAPAVKMG